MKNLYSCNIIFLTIIFSTINHTALFFAETIVSSKIGIEIISKNGPNDPFIENILIPSENNESSDFFNPFQVTLPIWCSFLLIVWDIHFFDSPSELFLSEPFFFFEGPEGILALMLGDIQAPKYTMHHLKPAWI